jgi:hypothetical protein
VVQEVKDADGKEAPPGNPGCKQKEKKEKKEKQNRLLMSPATDPNATLVVLNAM